MKRPIYTITENASEYRLQLFNSDAILILESKTFDTYRACEKFLDTLRVHLRFQTNFSRAKNMTGQYGFDIRTCWDDLIASSAWFSTREEREFIMEGVFAANTDAVFVHTSIFQSAPELILQEVA